MLAWLIVASGPLASAFSAPASAADVEVAAGQERFAPSAVTIPVGGSVVWRITEGSHTVTADDGAFDSKDRSAGETFTFTFPKAGRYTYSCQYDKEVGMVGQVQVRADGVTTTTAPAVPPAAAAAAAPPTTKPAPAPAPTTTTAVPETTTTTTTPPTPVEAWLGPAASAPSPPTPPAPEVAPPAEPPTDENAVTAVLEEQKGGSDDKGLLIAAAGAGGVALLGGGLWAWYHRSSRYLPA